MAVKTEVRGKEEHAVELNTFPDLLHVTVVNLNEANTQEELSNEASYMQLENKLPEMTLTQY